MEKKREKWSSFKTDNCLIHFIVGCVLAIIFTMIISEALAAGILISVIVDSLSAGVCLACIIIHCDATYKKHIVGFYRINKEAHLPSKRDTDAGYDIYASFPEDFMLIHPNETKMIPTGIASTFDKAYVAVLKERGSTGVLGIGQRAGIIDALKERGIQEGDTVSIYDLEFDYRN